MKLQTATAVTKLMMEVGAQLDASVKLVMDSSDSEEFSAYRSSVGNLMGMIYCDILTPIFRQHPQLTPEQLQAGDRERDT
jgi:hypothetical protein